MKRISLEQLSSCQPIASANLWDILSNLTGIVLE